MMDWRICCHSHTNSENQSCLQESQTNRHGRFQTHGKSSAKILECARDVEAFNVKKEQARVRDTIVFSLSTCSLFTLPSPTMAPRDWTKNPLWEEIWEDVMTGIIPKDMKPRQARLTRDKYREMDPKEFAQHLDGMCKSVAKEKLKEPPKEKWNKKNKVHRLLHDQMAVGIIPPDMDAATAQTLTEEYNKMPLAKRKSQFDGMQSIVNKKLARAKSDKDDLKHDLALCARPTHNTKGEPDWNLHEAPDLLKIDVDNEEKNAKRALAKPATVSRLFT